MIGDADRFEHPHRAGGDGAGAAVEGGVVPQVGVGGIDDDGGQAARVERGGERQADQPAAEDDDVRAIHSGRSNAQLQAWRARDVKTSLDRGVPRRAF